MYLKKGNKCFVFRNMSNLKRSLKSNVFLSVFPEAVAEKASRLTLGGESQPRGFLFTSRALKLLSQCQGFVIRKDTTRLINEGSPLAKFLQGGADMKKTCKTCPDYLRAEEHAEVEEELFGQAGIWDFKTCSKTCWQGARLKYQIASDKWYARKKALVIA